MRFSRRETRHGRANELRWLRTAVLADSVNVLHILGGSSSVCLMPPQAVVDRRLSSPRRALPIHVIVAAAILLRTIMSSNVISDAEAISLSTFLWASAVLSLSFLQCVGIIWMLESVILKVLPRISASGDRLRVRELIYLSMYPVWCIFIIAPLPFGGIFSSVLASLSMIMLVSGLKYAGCARHSERVMLSLTTGGVALITFGFLQVMTSAAYAALAGFPAL